MTSIRGGRHAFRFEPGTASSPRSPRRGQRASSWKADERSEQADDERVAQTPELDGDLREHVLADDDERDAEAPRAIE